MSIENTLDGIFFLTQLHLSNGTKYPKGADYFLFAGVLKMKTETRPKEEWKMEAVEFSWV